MLLRTLIRPITQHSGLTSIRSYLMVPFVVLTVSAVSITGWLSIRNGQRAVNDVANQLRQQVTLRVREYLLNYLEAPLLINQINADAISLEQLDLNEGTSLERHLWRQIQQFEGEVIAIGIGREDGEYTGIGRPGSGSVLKFGIAGQATNGKFHEYSIDEGDRLGNPRILNDYDPRLRPWYLQAKRSQSTKSLWSEIYTDFVDPRLVITASQSFYNQAGQLQGVLLTDLLLSHIGSYLQDLRISPNGQVFVIDPTGMLVASSEENQKPFVIKSGVVERISVMNDRDEYNTLRQAAEFVEAELGDFSQIRRTGSFDLTIDQQRYFLQITPLRDAQFPIITSLSREQIPGWLILVLVPESDFMEQIQRNTQQTIWLCLSTLAIAILAGLLTSRLIVKPILSLKKAAQSLSQGNYQLVPIEREDELGVLAQSFNQMSEQLRASFEELEHRVVARTIELQIANEQLRREILERRQIEIALRESEDLYRNIVENAKDLITKVSPDGEFVYISPNLPNILGYDVEQLLGSRWSALVHLDDFPQLKQFLEQTTTLEDNRTSPAYRILHQDGQWRWFTSTIAPVENEQQELLYYVGISRDIGDLVEAENNLRQAMAVANAANYAKSEFLAHMSHELRTPLNAIMGYAQILQPQSNLTPQQQENLSIIYQSGEHLLTLINDILDLSKIEARKMELHIGEFDLLKLLRNITALFQMRTQQQGLTFLYEPISPLPTGVRGDEQRLRQILLNLLSNAVKFTEQGGVVLRVGYVNSNVDNQSEALKATRSTVPAASPLRFEVEDTGRGIAEKDLEAIFQPFQQVGDRKYHPGGTGLGLSISKRLVEMMGGQLQVKSAPGEGSVFWFDLDLPSVEAWQEEDEPDRTIRGYQGQRLKILVTDDKPENRGYLVQVLEPLGFHVMEAEDGLDCLQKTAIFQPDVILMDLVMPRMDGFEATRRIRQAIEWQNVIIIATSASAFDQDQQRSLAVGCNGFVSKPIRKERLLLELEQQLHLKWTYADEEAGAAIASATHYLALAAAPEQNPVYGLEASPASVAVSEKSPVDLLTTLHDMALIGDVMGILQETELLEQIDSQWAQVAVELRQLAKTFQVRKMQKLIARCYEILNERATD
jgi:PAS domain S-box-containing protein